MKAAAVPVGQSWMWTLAFGHHEERTPMLGYEPTREAGWRRSRRVGEGDREVRFRGQTGKHLVPLSLTGSD